MVAGITDTNGEGFTVRRVAVIDEEIRRRKDAGEDIGHLPCHAEIVALKLRLRRLARRYLRLRRSKIAALIVLLALAILSVGCKEPEPRHVGLWPQPRVIQDGR